MWNHCDIELEVGVEKKGDEVILKEISLVQKDREEDLKKQLPSEQIRVICDEMKWLKRIQKEGSTDPSVNRRYADLFDKYEKIDILFGREESLLKAIIFYLDQVGKNLPL
jgi:hypothetical protein